MINNLRNTQLLSFLSIAVLLVSITLHCKPNPLGSAKPKPLPMVTSLSIFRDIPKASNDGGATEVPGTSLRDMPYLSTGVIMVQHESSPSQCTASLVQGVDGKKYAMTAAHCIFDLQRKTVPETARSVDFCIAPKDGSCNTEHNMQSISFIKLFQRLQLDADGFQSKINLPFFLFDLAIVDLQDKPPEPTLVFPPPPASPPKEVANVISLGFPNGGPFKPATLYQYVADRTSIVPVDNYSKYMPGNNMLGGSSGGPWVFQQADGTYAVTGLNSSGLGSPGSQAIVSPVLSQYMYDLFTCATNGKGCNPYADGDGSIKIGGRVIFESTSDVAIDKQAVYLSEGTTVSLNSRRFRAACSNSPIEDTSLELTLVTVDSKWIQQRTICKDLGIVGGLNSFSVTLLKDKREPKLILTAKGTSDGQIELRTYKDSIYNLKLLATAVTSGTTDPVNNVVVKQVLNNNFAVFKINNGNLVIEVWSVDFTTGQIAKTGSSYTGPGVSAFSVASLSANLGFTPQILVAATISDQVNLLPIRIDYSLGINMYSLFNTRLGLDDVRGARGHVLQMDNGTIALAHVDEGQNAKVTSYHMDRQSNLNQIAGPIPVAEGSYPTEVSIADMGNDILVAASSGDRMKNTVFTTVRVKDDSSLSLLSSQGLFEGSNMTAIAPLAYGVTSGGFSNAYIAAFRTRTDASGSSFIISSLGIAGGNNMRFVTMTAKGK